MIGLPPVAGLASVVGPRGVVYPARYGEANLPGPTFHRLVAEAMRPGMAVLDVGSGNDPTVPPAGRPPGVTYAGLDISRAELERAPAGSYDETWVADLARRVPELEGRFDLVLSFQVLEHVAPLDVALENVRAYLKPGGVFLAVFTGTFAYFALVGRVVPDRAKRWLLRRAQPDVDLADIFPAPYHHCYASALERDLARWGEVEVLDFHASAGYLERVSAPACRLYLRLEDRLAAGDHRNLASNYVVRAVR